MAAPEEQFFAQHPSQYYDSQLHRNEPILLLCEVAFVEKAEGDSRKQQKYRRSVIEPSLPCDMTRKYFCG